MDEYKPLAPGPGRRVQPGSEGGKSRKNPWLIGCGIGCGFLILVIGIVTVVSILWIRKGGELVESSSIPARDPITVLDLRVDYKDKGMRDLLRAIMAAIDEVDQEADDSPEWVKNLEQMSGSKGNRSSPFGLKSFLPVHLAMVEERTLGIYDRNSIWVGSCERFGNLYRLFFNSLIGPSIDTIGEVDGTKVFRNESNEQLAFRDNILVVVANGDWEQMEGVLRSLGEEREEERVESRLPNVLGPHEDGRLRLTEASNWKGLPVLREIERYFGPGDGTLSIDVRPGDSVVVGIDLRMQGEEAASGAAETMETVVDTLLAEVALEVDFDLDAHGERLEGTAYVRGISVWFRDWFREVSVAGPDTSGGYYDYDAYDYDEGE